MAQSPIDIFQPIEEQKLKRIKDYNARQLGEFLYY